MLLFSFRCWNYLCRLQFRTRLLNFSPSWNLWHVFDQLSWFSHKTLLTPVEPLHASENFVGSWRGSSVSAVPSRIGGVSVGSVFFAVSTAYGCCTSPRYEGRSKTTLILHEPLDRTRKKKKGTDDVRPSSPRGRCLAKGLLAQDPGSLK